jgi:hypothetical protein
MSDVYAHKKVTFNGQLKNFTGPFFLFLLFSVLAPAEVLFMGPFLDGQRPTTATMKG